MNMNSTPVGGGHTLRSGRTLQSSGGSSSTRPPKPKQPSSSTPSQSSGGKGNTARPPPSSTGIPQPSSHGQKKTANMPRKRFTPTIEACQMIRKELQKGKHEQKHSLACRDEGSDKSAKHYLESYTLSTAPNFDLSLHESIHYNNRPTLPSNHPNHSYHLERAAIDRLPSRDILLSGDFNRIQLARDLKLAIKRKYDVDSRKLKAFHPADIISNAYALARKEQPGTNATIKAKPACASQSDLDKLVGATSNIAVGHKQLTSDVAGLALTVSNLASENKQLVAGLTKNVSNLATGHKQLSSTVSSLASGHKQLQQQVALHSTEITGIKSRLEELSTSNQKNWGEMRAERQLQAQDVGGRVLFAAASPSQDSLVYSVSPAAARLASPLCRVDESTSMVSVELADIAALKHNYLMEAFKMFQDQDLSKMTTITEWQRKNLNEFFGNALLSGTGAKQPLVSMKRDFAQSEFLLLNGDASTLEDLESLAAFAKELDESILAIPNPTNKHDTVFVLPESCESFVFQDFLPCIAGADHHVLLCTDSDVELSILARTPESATEVFCALLHLTAKGNTTALDVEFSSIDDKNQGKAVSIPIKKDPMETFPRVFDISLRWGAITDKQQAENIVRCFGGLTFVECKIEEEAVANCFVDFILNGDHSLKCLKFSRKWSLSMAHTALSNLVLGLCQKDGPSTKFVFNDGGTSGLPTPVLEAIGNAISSALGSGNDLKDRLEFDSHDLPEPFVKMVKTSLEKVLAAKAGRPKNPLMDNLVADGTLPIGLTGLRTKKQNFAEKVKRLLDEATATSNDVGATTGEPAHKRARVS